MAFAEQMTDEVVAERLRLVQVLLTPTIVGYTSSVSLTADSFLSRGSHADYCRLNYPTEDAAIYSLHF